ncbi:ABC transporter ATP-binding protein [Acidaminobacter sp. JC074]|uniref:ABC transporter ATP-binding protein n=1 Tax=Acidaminobacter sp. JC074 TaxID=2530199 RepID=UPI001F0D6557|nr:dipeptide/oligopeptide/nickel ABC transporter ATP-binding protein [Acidaminobacter sp. JC074]MCH4891034.1 ABC transporter ATP-binding protein [Acidaminobacter sp. JC074]
MIHIKSLRKTYQKVQNNGKKSTLHALDQVDFEIKSNRIYAIVGESGSGKSTLGKIISGLESHDEGCLYYKGDLVRNKSFFYRKNIRQNIQLVQQDTYSALNPKMTIYQCVLEPIKNFRRLTSEEEKRLVYKLLDLVELDESVMFKRPNQLSGGQQKRVNIARAIACEPELLILDEATSGLDVVVKKKILDLLKKIQNEKNCSILMITHDIDVAMYMSHHISVMKDGKILEQVNFENDLSCFNHAYSNVLIESTFLG